MGHDQDRPQLLPLLPRMVQWCGTRALAQTGVRTVISGLFGQYADQRVLQAALDISDEVKLAERYDYSGEVKPPETPVLEADGTVWVDYVADIGDGFDSTYAI